MVLSVLSVVVAISLQMYKSDADAKAREIKEQFERLEKQNEKAVKETEVAMARSQEMGAKTEAAQREMSRELTERLQRQAADESRIRDYLESIARIHGSAFSELLAALPSDLASSEAMNRLRNKGLELQARMDLLAHHDRNRQWVAVSSLSAVGTKVAIPDLVRLRDTSGDTGISLHAAEALRKIQSRVDATGGRPPAAGFTADSPSG